MTDPNKKKCIPEVHLLLYQVLVQSPRLVKMLIQDNDTLIIKPELNNDILKINTELNNDTLTINTELNKDILTINTEFNNDTLVIKTVLKITP